MIDTLDVEKPNASNLKQYDKFEIKKFNLTVVKSVKCDLAVGCSDVK